MPDPSKTIIHLVDGTYELFRNSTGCVDSPRKIGRWVPWLAPKMIPDYLALVGDAADGYPGIAGSGPKGAARLLLRYGEIEKFPEDTLGEKRELALLFKKLATLRTDAPLFGARAAGRT